PEKLPDIAHFLNLIQIQVRDDHFVFVTRAFGNDLPAGRAEITLPVKFTDVPRILAADAIDGADEVAVGYGVSRLLAFPKVLAKARNCCRGIEDDFGCVQTEGPSPLRKMAIVADINADIRKLRFEHRVSKIARLEVELLPEPRRAMRDVVLAIFAEIPTV